MKTGKATGPEELRKKIVHLITDRNSEVTVALFNSNYNAVKMPKEC